MFQNCQRVWNPSHWNYWFTWPDQNVEHQIWWHMSWSLIQPTLIVSCIMCARCLTQIELHALNSAYNLHVSRASRVNMQAIAPPYPTSLARQVKYLFGKFLPTLTLWQVTRTQWNVSNQEISGGLACHAPCWWLICSGVACGSTGWWSDHCFKSVCAFACPQGFRFTVWLFEFACT